jgi:hypothetical protein
MTKPLLVLVHGRAQGGKDETELRNLWIKTLREGLGASRRDRLDEVEIRFPFYGDRLDDLVAEAINPTIDAIHRGAASAGDQAFAQFQLDYVNAVKERRHIADDQILDGAGAVIVERGPLQWAWVQAILRKLDDIPGLSGDMIERFTRDVWVYLTDDHVHDAINGIVAKCLEPGRRTVVVGHSLGSVVAYDVLRKTGNLSVPLYATVGSPLGVGPIRSRLSPVKFPAGVAAWYNAYDERDAVALYPLDQKNFGVQPAIENYNKVQNGTDNAHGIIGYLNDTKVAGKIFAALFG